MPYPLMRSIKERTDKMVDYLYDGSFEGLLTCIYLHYYEEKASGIFLKSRYQTNLLNPYKEINTDLSLADKVYLAIEEKISTYALKNIYYLYLSDYEQKEMLILNYLKTGFKIGKYINCYHADPTVHNVHFYSKKVSIECHRFYGLIRFSDTGMFLYSEIEPDNDILILLGDHFSDRFKNERFIIHDKKRSKALISSDGEWYISDFDSKKEITLSEEEHYYQDLWKTYFKHIGIDGRKNARLQAQFMPRRYWKNLTEF